MKKFKINVTERDIRHGKPGRPSHCMVARAVRRATKKKIVYVFPHIKSVTLHINGRKRYLQLPEHVRKLALKFDKIHDAEARVRRIKPFSFILQA